MPKRTPYTKYKALKFCTKDVKIRPDPLRIAPRTRVVDTLVISHILIANMDVKNINPLDKDPIQAVKFN